MRKKMVAALISIFIAASLAACGGNSGTGSPTANTDQVQESEAATEQTEPADEQAESGQNESQTAPAVEEMGKLSLDTTIERQYYLKMTIFVLSLKAWTSNTILRICI